MKTETFDTVFLIVLYNKKLDESETFNKLISSDYILNRSKLIVWNNGPDKISKKIIGKYNISVDFIEDLNNSALSKIYNIFLENYKSNRYVILDDDTSITDEYIVDVYNVKKENIGVPLVKFKDNIVSPIINGEYFIDYKDIDNKDKVVAIGSGLVIGSKLKKDFYKKYDKLFDERFLLYGVDTTLFFRIRELGLTNKIKIIRGFYHSLSRLESESIEKEKFRLSERGSSEGLIFYYYYSRRVTCQLLVKNFFPFITDFLLKKKQFYFRKYFLLALITGKHHRS